MGNSKIYTFGNIEPLFEVINTDSGVVLEMNEKTKQAFIYAVNSDKFMYVLYSGRGINDPDFTKSNIIYKMNWEGEVLKKLVLDKDVSSFGVSANDDFIYSFDIETGPILLTETN